MPTFETGSAIPDTEGAILLPVPFVSWFNDSVVNALSEMTIGNNWLGDDFARIEDAKAYASEMIARMQILNFNPFPIGLIVPFASDTPPDGYLLCDGTSYATADYPELFTVISYNFGGSGANFNVPSLFNRSVVGSGADFAYMDVGGAETVTLATGEMPSHNHSAANPTIIDPSHSHVVTSVLPTLITIGAGVPAPSAVPSVGSTAPALTGISALAGAIGNTGGDGAHENMPPFMALPYIIYAGRENV